MHFFIPFIDQNVLFSSPRFGSQLGGTPVIVFGPCFEQSDSVECSFGGISTPGIFVSRERFMCISPAMDTLGRVEVTIEVKRNGTLRFQRNVPFYSRKYYICNERPMYFYHNMEVINRNISNCT